MGAMSDIAMDRQETTSSSCIICLWPLTRSASPPPPPSPAVEADPRHMQETLTFSKIREVDPVLCFANATIHKQIHHPSSLADQDQTATSTTMSGSYQPAVGIFPTTSVRVSLARALSCQASRS